MKNTKKIAVVIISIILCVQAFGQLYKVNAKQVAGAAMTVCALEENIQNSSKLDVYVFGNKQISRELKKYKNQLIGNVTLNSIKYGNELPKNKPTVIILDDVEKYTEVKEYCRKNNVISISCCPELTEQGLSVGIGSDVKKQDSNFLSLSSVKLLVNLEASRLEGSKWNQDFYDVATVINDNQMAQRINH